MRFATFLVGAILALTSAVSGVKELQQFKVQTKVIEGNKKLDGLWAYLYHTGAGFADVTFSAKKSDAFSAFLNNTQFQWVYTGAPYPYALSLEYQTYASWGPVQVTAGFGDETYGKGFKFQNGNQIVDTFEEWTGWLVCDWWHLVPELFWTQIDSNLTILDTCAKVQLIART